MAAKLAEALVNQVNHCEDVHAAETLEEAYNRCDGVGELEGESPPVTVSEPAQKNRELRQQVGSRPFEHVQRLRKDMGHISNDTLCKMLEEVQAMENVLTAAKHYVCPVCAIPESAQHKLQPAQVWKAQNSMNASRWTAIGSSVKIQSFNNVHLQPNARSVNCLADNVC